MEKRRTQMEASQDRKLNHILQLLQLQTASTSLQAAQSNGEDFETQESFTHVSLPEIEANTDVKAAKEKPELKSLLILQTVLTTQKAVTRGQYQ